MPKDKTIMICAHSQMFKKHSSFSTRNRNYAVYRDELLKFKNVYSWAGHNHHTYIYNYNRSEQMPIENLTAVTVTRSTGSLRLNKHLNNDGTPQGYMIVDVNGDDVSWYYHSCGKDRSHQMRLYSPVRTGSDYVLANVWTWDDAWGPVEWWENGVKVGEMEPCEEFDPDYVDLYATVTNKTTRKYCQPGKVVPHVPHQALGGREGGRGPGDRPLRNDLCGARELVRYGFGYRSAVSLPNRRCFIPESHISGIPNRR